LNVPDRVAAASTEYLDDEDVLQQFLTDETVTDPAGFMTTTDLHDRFQFWCERQGLNAWTLHTLRKELKSRGFQDHRRPHGRGFIGLKSR
jgi:phage/plasmid-associated DNA primase